MSICKEPVYFYVKEREKEEMLNGVGITFFFIKKILSTLLTMYEMRNWLRKFISMNIRIVARHVSLSVSTKSSKLKL